MTRRLKSMGLALAAVVALGAVVASGAQAAPEFFHSHLGEANPDSVIITAEQTGNHVIKTKPSGGAEIVCAAVKFEGTEEVTITKSDHELAAAVGEHLNGTFTHEVGGVKTLTNTSITETPTYSSCTAFGFAATVTTTGCHFRLTAETDVNGHGQIHQECEAGKSITVSAGGCTLSIGSQTPAGGVHYTNNEAGLNTKSTYDIGATVTATGISYTASGFACSLLGISSASTGTYTGGVTVKGFEDQEKTSTGTYKELKQVGIWKGPTK